MKSKNDQECDATPILNRYIKQRELYLQTGKTSFEADLALNQYYKELKQKENSND